MDQPISKEHISKLKRIFDEIENNPNSFEFREPVDWKELGLNEYPKLIKKPMDLSTCKKNLLKNKYR